MCVSIPVATHVWRTVSIDLQQKSKTDASVRCVLYGLGEGQRKIHVRGKQTEARQTKLQENNHGSNTTVGAKWGEGPEPRISTSGRGGIGDREQDERTKYTKQ